MRFLLACQPRNYYLLPVNGLRKSFSLFSVMHYSNASLVQREVAFSQENDGGIVLSYFHPTYNPSAAYGVMLHEERKAFFKKKPLASLVYDKGAFHIIHLRSPFVCFHSSAIAFFEPRHYGGVFVLQ